MNINFTKMNGCGNDFVIIDCRTQQIHLSSEQITSLADYKKSIGFDQLLLIENCDHADIAVKIFNNDGSKALACGNGSRCVASLLLEEQSTLTMKTENRIITANLQDDLVAINMGKADILKENISLYGLQGDLMDIGNPHIVINITSLNWNNLESLNNIQVLEYGNLIENDALFPNKVNVNFAKIIARDFIYLRTFERGAGATLACGTGACATFACLYKKGLVDSKITIRQLGGDLNLSIQNEQIFMAGQTNINYRGTINI